MPETEKLEVWVKVKDMPEMRGLIEKLAAWAEFASKQPKELLSIEDLELLDEVRGIADCC